MSYAVTFNRSEIVKITLQVGVGTVLTYYCIKWFVEQLDPTTKSKKKAAALAREKLLRISTGNHHVQLSQLTDHETIIASHLIVPEDIQVSWTDVAGQDDLIKDLKETVFLPIKRRDLFSDSRLTMPPKGILLHGPPGCGKTLIAKATAKEVGTRFINLDIAMLVDKWYGESQKLTAAVFSLAVKLQPCIIFIDEIDSLLRSRNRNDHEATAMMKAQFMSLWDGLITDPECTVIVMGATNRPSDLDPAIRRRMPATFYISIPNLTQREKILKVILAKEPVDSEVNYRLLAEQTEDFSGSDLHEMCRQACVYRVREYIDCLDSTNGSAQNSLLAIGFPENTDASTAINQFKGSLSISISEQNEDPKRSDEDSKEEYHDTLRPITMQDLVLSLGKLKESKRHCNRVIIDN